MHRYILKRGKKIVCFGYAGDIRDRMGQHISNGHRFTHFIVESPRVTEKTARRWQMERMRVYRHGHGGINPEYNRTDV